MSGVKAEAGSASPIDQWLTLAVVTASIVCLTWSAQATLGPVLPLLNEPIVTWRIVVDGEPVAPEEDVQVLEVLVDGQRLRWRNAERTGNWEPTSLWRAARHVSSGGPGTLQFRGRHVVVEFESTGASGTLAIERDGRTVARFAPAAPRVDAASPILRTVRRVEFPEPRAPASFAPFCLLLLLACAVLLRPWARHTSGDTWVLLHVTLMVFFVWLTMGVGSEDDSLAYVDGVRMLAQGLPASHPPGTSLLVAASLLLSSRQLGNAMTFLQAIMMILAALWLFRALRAELPRSVALAAVLAAFSATSVTLTARAVMSEATAIFGVAGAVYFFGRSSASGRPLHAVLGGACAGWATLARVTPAIVLAPAVVILVLGRRQRFFSKTTAVFVLTALLIVLAPMVWYAVRGQPFTLTYSGPGHLYNRVVYAQRLLHLEGQATQRLIAALGPPENWINSQHWIVLHQLSATGMNVYEAYGLMGDVAREALNNEPLAFLRFSLTQFHRLLRNSRTIGPFAGFGNEVPAIENKPVLAYSESGGRWASGIAAVERNMWPWLALSSSVVLCGLAFVARRAALLLALGAGAFASLLFIASSESVVDARYVIPVQPFLAVVTVGGVWVLLSVLREHVSA
jgi:4-amino-4-deoxy-L-arabinose transferase-like glycosyltransferase